MNAAMLITTADHVNLHVRDPEATLAFYEGVLHLQSERLDDFRAGKRPLFAFRVSADFIRQMIVASRLAVVGRVRKDVDLVVEGASPQEMVAYLRERGVAIEREFENLWGARGDGWACYVRDPDGYRVELKIY